MSQPKSIRSIRLICDLQFGSTGKGLIAGYLAEKYQPDTLVAAWSPNAGHTYISSQHEKFIHTMLPNGIVSPALKRVMLGPGSTINLDSLYQEVKAAAVYTMGITIYIHGNATIVQQKHRDEEAGPMTKIGSTKKGCGAALIEKIRRDPDTEITAKHWEPEIETMFQGLYNRYNIDVQIVPTQAGWLNVLALAHVMQIEGAQGYSLGMLSGFYPYTTSRECTPAQICIDCGVPAYWDMVRIGSARTYPIRVANRYDDQGDMVGWSGPCYAGQTETTWDRLGVPVEITTVTKLPRRVFSFSRNQIREAVEMTGVDEIFLNFVNYWDGVDFIKDNIYTTDAIRSCKEFGATLAYVGHGPAHKDVEQASRVPGSGGKNVY